MAVTRTRIVIVGAGTAGLAALREIRDQTDDFILINDGPYGTTCARVGCMPSKALIAAANAFHARSRLETFGINGAENVKADIPSVMKRVRALRDDFVSGVLRATDGLGARNIAGRARLDGPNRVIVGNQVIEADRIILAPGSSPIVPGPWKKLGDSVFTTDSFFELEDLPRRIGVIGLGAIGAELAQALARLGLEVHAFDGSRRIAGVSDEKVAAILENALREEYSIHLETQVELAAAGDGAVAISWNGGSVIVDKVLAAVGRSPNFDGLGLETLGVPLDSRGMPKVDPTTMRIADTDVFLAGDANGHNPLLHEGTDEGHIAGICATHSEQAELRRRTPLGIVFCDPEVAAVGMRADALEPANTIIGEVSFANQGRARTMQVNQGLLRVYARRSDGRLLGAEMAAPSAEHLAHLLALAIDRDLNVHDLLRMPFYHPTLEEGLRTALRAIARQLPPCSISDLARCKPLNVQALE
ncbi:MAG: dihydrolipoyl dehydrogenase [Rhodobiaceae bacterium]|nr:dihydrolipoyl dehydrogenase [Rhodobiaceae bacterium]MCC0055088.1 dihydrolipoyl dehydrogenase [Rhodobiaceae bacterium]